MKYKYIGYQCKRNEKGQLSAKNVADSWPLYYIVSVLLNFHTTYVRTVTSIDLDSLTFSDEKWHTHSST